MTREEWEDVLYAAVPDEVVQDQLNDYVLSLEAENAKLRELVGIAVNHCDSGTCDECPIQGEGGGCTYLDMARELGIEVG